jgi:hypothetical protein
MPQMSPCRWTSTTSAAKHVTSCSRVVELIAIAAELCSRDVRIQAQLDDVAGREGEGLILALKLGPASQKLLKRHNHSFPLSLADICRNSWFFGESRVGRSQATCRLCSYPRAALSA